MIISIKGATNRGWRKYVTYGTDKKPRDTSKVKILYGDLLQGDRIENLTKYKENSYLILLSFKDRIDEKIIRAVLNEFEENFLMGFDKDEYHFDAVWHRDTDDDHIHIRIPKINLRTQTQLQLYFDKKDRLRINAIRDYLDVKYQLESPLDNKVFFKEDNKPYKSNLNIEKFITKNILELHQSELLDSFDDMKAFIKEQGVKIIKTGYDKPNDFHYLTIENKSEKIRIKGDIYDEKFWRDSREIREKQINNNQRNRDMGGDNKRELSELKEQLDKYNVRRRQEIYRHYNPSRKRATECFNKREQENISKYQNKREKRISFFSLKPFTLNCFNNYFSVHPISVSKQRLESPQRVPSQTKRKFFRSDTQERFIRHQGWRINVFQNKGKELNEQIIRRYFTQIREKRSIDREGEKRLFEQIEISNNRLSKNITKSEQNTSGIIEKSRRELEINFRRDREEIEQKINLSNTKNRRFTNTIRELLERANEEIRVISKSIKRVVDDIKNMKLFEEAKKQVASKQIKTKIKPSIPLSIRR